ncbi:hypothetical protein L7F22_003002 [Adiantum nelumboides]|nr:hypothetical protein [Adiantum nelumboides]
MSSSRGEKYGYRSDGLDEDLDGYLSESDGESISLASRDTEEDSEEEGSESENEEISDEHYAAIRSTVIDITTALGGLEEDIDENGNIRKIYAIGDECLRCLRDLRTLLHQDEDDTTRVIPMIFSEVNVVQRGLLPLLLKAADMGERGSKIALACTDLITTLTWPIDMAAEIQAAINKDDNSAAVPDYRRFQSVLVSYKASILRSRSGETGNKSRSVLSTIMLHILLPAISKPRHKRTEREIGTISMCLHLFRNLLAIRDPEATSLSGSELIALSNLQNDLLVELKSSHVLETLLMLASNAQSRDFEAWNIVTAECVYHIYSSALPEQLIQNNHSHHNSGPSTSSTSRQNTSLQNSLKAESRLKNSEILSSGTSRHSRYSTTINFKDAEGAVRIARTQRALRKTKEELQLQYKEKKQKRKIQRKRALDEIGASRPRRSWTSAAKVVVSEWAKDFVQMGFEPLIRSVVKDIRSESFKAGDIAQTRTKMMRLSNFFLEYFLLQKANEDRQRQAKRQRTSENELVPNEEDEAIEWTFDLIDYWLEPWALKMAWMRANTARDDKTWLEFVTAVKLWTTLLKLVDMLSKSSNRDDTEMAEGILAMHFYDELALDAAKAITKSYGNQSFRCLEAILDFAHVMPKALERYSKDKENLFVKMKKQAKKRAEKDQGVGENDNAATNAEEEEQEMRQVVESKIKERKFEFEKFQSHLSSNQLVEASFTYLARWLDVTERVEEHISGVVHILHRLAIKANNLRLFFPYEKRLAIKKLQKDAAFWQYLQSNAPKIVPDAQKLFKYILDKFERLDETEKGYWAEGMRAPKPVKVFKMPTEIEIIDSKGQAEDIKIAVNILMEADKLPAVMWIKSHLEESLRSKVSIVDEIRGESDESHESDEEHERSPDKALERASELFNDHRMSYFDDNELRDDASKRPELKLLCRLINLRSNEDDDHHWVWTIPSTHMPEELKSQIEMIEDGMKGELRDEPWSSFVRRVRKQNRITRTVVNEFGEEEQVYVPRQRAPRKENRPNTFVDDLIEDSDEEIEAAERMIAQQRMQEARQNHNDVDSDDDDEANLSNLDNAASPLQNRIRSSDRSSRSSSVTGSSVHNDISPQKLSQARNKRTIGSLRRNKPSDGLFFGNQDSEEEDSQQETPKKLRITQASSPVRSDSDVDIEGDHSSAALNEAQLSYDPTIRKKRALIIDSDDDE